MLQSTQEQVDRQPLVRCRFSARCAIILTIAALFAIFDAEAVSAQQIWFGTRMPDYHAKVVEDFSALFKPTPDWNKLATQIQVLLMSEGFIRIMPDDQLKAISQELAGRHIQIAIPLQSIAKMPNEACGGEEGYGNPKLSGQVIDKLVRLGIKPQIIRLDGPLWFGEFKPQGCKLTSAEVARRVGLVLAPYIQAFPDIVIGDVEPPIAVTAHSGWQAEFRALKSGIEADIHKPLTFLHADITWRVPNWPTAAIAMGNFARSTGMKYGITYNSIGINALAKHGNASDTSIDTTDVAWVEHAKQHFTELESQYGFVPDQAVFQSWNDNPTHVFPEDSPTTLSYLIAQYLLPRTRFVAQRTADRVQGRLVEANGSPVPEAMLTLTGLGSDLSHPPAVRIATGTVPADARFAILALRVNKECFCSGSNDLVVGDLTYTEKSGGGATARYSLLGEDAPRVGKMPGDVSLRAEPVQGHDMARLIVPPNANFSVNSQPFAVTPGAQFEFKVPFASRSGLFGSVAVIWQDASRKGLSRTMIRVAADQEEAGTTRTDAQGNFVFSHLGPNAGRSLRLTFGGSSRLRAAYAELP